MQETPQSEDPRWLRSRKALTEAVLELASEHPIHLITVNTVTKRAGIDRTTFYNHAESPEALLSTTLRDELDDLFDRFHNTLKSQQRTPQEAQEQGIRTILEHVARRRAIYRASLRNGNDNLLQSVIGAHLAKKAMVLLEESFYQFRDGAKLDAFGRQFAARGVAWGMVGTLTTWLRESPDLDADLFIENYRVLFPDWFTMANLEQPHDNAQNQPGPDPHN